MAKTLERLVEGNITTLEDVAGLFRLSQETYGIYSLNDRYISCEECDGDIGCYACNDGCYTT